jgi:hypothetical protein
MSYKLAMMPRSFNGLKKVIDWREKGRSGTEACAEFSIPRNEKGAKGQEKVDFLGGSDLNASKEMLGRVPRRQSPKRQISIVPPQ